MLPFSQEVLHYDTIYLFKGGFLLAVQLHGLYCSVTCHCLCLLFMTWLLGGLPNHHHPTWSLLFTAEKATSTGRLPLLLLSLECKIQDNSPYFCTNCSVAHLLKIWVVFHSPWLQHLSSFHMQFDRNGSILVYSFHFQFSFIGHLNLLEFLF